MHRYSLDGYVRLPEYTINRLQLVHVDSGIDEALLASLRGNSIDAVHAGYTEWQRAHCPGILQISVGWDWYLDRASGALLIAWGDVRSNIMGTDQLGVDVGMDRTTKALTRRLAQLNWPRAITNQMDQHDLCARNSNSSLQ